MKRGILKGMEGEMGWKLDVHWLWQPSPGGHGLTLPGQHQIGNRCCWAIINVCCQCRGGEHSLEWGEDAPEMELKLAPILAKDSKKWTLMK